MLPYTFVCQIPVIHLLPASHRKCLRDQHLVISQENVLRLFTSCYRLRHQVPRWVCDHNDRPTSDRGAPTTWQKGLSHALRAPSAHLHRSLMLIAKT